MGKALSGELSCPCDKSCFVLVFGQVRKLFITSYILNEFSCDKMQIPCLRKQQMNILRVVVFYRTMSKDFLSFLEVCGKIKGPWKQL